MPVRAARRAGVLAAVFAVVWMGLSWLILPAPRASAHAYLLASTPPEGYAIPTAPAAITLDFDEAVTLGPGALALADLGRRPYPLGPVSVTLAGRRITAPVTTPLPEGGYRLRWQVTADDGDLVSGVISFSVGPAAFSAQETGGGSTVDSPLVVAARWVLFTGLALALGGLGGHLLAGRVAREADGALTAGYPGPSVALGSGLGLLGVLILAIAQSGVDLTRLPRTGPGTVLVIEAAGFGIALALACGADRITQPESRARPIPVPAAMGVDRSLASPGRSGHLDRDAGRHRRGVRAGQAVALLAVAGAEGWRAHPHALSPLWGGALSVIHLLAVGGWVGGLIQMVALARSWRDHPGALRLLVFDYSRLARVAVALTVVSGVGEAMLLFPAPDMLLTTGYGQVLLAKLVGVVVALGLAMAARRRLRRSIATDIPPLGRAARIEALTLIAVLGAAALLVSTAPPLPASTVLPAPPPPIGPTVTVGTLAGYTTVIATASAGRLTLRMTVPGRDDLGTTNAPDNPTPANSPSYQITAQPGAPDPGAPEPGARPLAMRGCGPGCFTAPITWRNGSNPLRIDIAAAPWPAATAHLDIPWPLHPDTEHLPAMLAAMRAVPTMTAHQSVTSNYTGDPGPEHILLISGPDYLGAEPYAAGGGNPTTVPTGTDLADLRLGFPQGIAIRLLLASDGRILREEETTPNHLVTTTIEYPATSR